MYKEIKMICADCSGVKNHVFSFGDNPWEDDNDCRDTCVIWDRITFYGVPFDFEDNRIDLILSGDYSGAIKIGEIYGCLLLCKKMISMGEEPWEVCDDLHGDLEYTISALRDFDGPLNAETGDDYQDIYYINQIKLEPEYNENSMKSRIIEELPNVLFRLFHINPDILAFYPAPRKYDIPPEEIERRELLGQIASAKLNGAFSEAMGVAKDEDNTIAKFANAYQFSEDEVNLIMRRRHSSSSYPEEAKDMVEFDFYLANDFKEAGDSRLLYKVVTQDS